MDYDFGQDCARTGSTRKEIYVSGDRSHILAGSKAAVGSSAVDSVAAQPATDSGNKSGSQVKTANSNKNPATPNARKF